MRVTPVSFRNGEKPAPQACHDNVRRWVLENPGTKHIAGWILTSSTEHWCQFEAHSVVLQPDGSWLDITPRNADPVLFLAHEGNDAEFWEIEKRFKQYQYCR